MNYPTQKKGPVAIPQGPLEAFDQCLGKMRDMVEKLVADNDRMLRKELELLKHVVGVEQARDAFQDQCKQLGELVAELREVAR